MRYLYRFSARRGSLSFAFLPMLFLLFTTMHTQAQVTEEWVRYADTGLLNNYATPSDMAIDKNGNVYVTGMSYSSVTNEDYVTIKYSPDGTQLWVKSYNNPASNSNDEPTAIALDGNGNVYVTGRSGSSTGFDYATVKYSPDGTELWVKRYTNFKGNDEATAIAIDKQGNVYVTGQSVGNYKDYDYATVKYSSDGTELWVERYNYLNDPLAANKTDQAIAIAVDENGNVYVTGNSVSKPASGYSTDYATLKYSSDGILLWVQRYDNGYGDAAVAMAIDGSGNVYVTGTSNKPTTFDDFATVKYSPDGIQLWAKQYDNGFGTEGARDIAVDKSGNVYVTGSSIAAGNNVGDYATVKYSPDGTQLWAKAFDSGLGSDAASDIIVDESGNVYVTGLSAYYDARINYATFKYNTNGTQLWLIRYGTPRYKDQYEIPTAIGLDGKGNVYVTGLSRYYGQYSFATVKYSQASCVAEGSIRWEVWTKITGPLVSAIPVDTPPNSVHQLTSFQTPSNLGDSYGQRIRGYVCVAVSGNYTFYIAGDNNCELWLSVDENPANKVKIAHITGNDAWAGMQQWTKYTSQKSVVKPLVAGKRYYIEALHKEKANGDNLAVGWVLPNTTAIKVIPGSRLSPFVPTSTAREGFEDIAQNKDAFNRMQVQVYPNPNAGDKLVVTTAGAFLQGEVLFILYNAVGEKINTRKVVSHEGGVTETAFVFPKRLASGLYTLTMTTAHQTKTTKVIVQ